MSNGLSTALPINELIFSNTLIGFQVKFSSGVIFSELGLISKCLGFVQSLPGFYIAALAAIATFNRPDIDRIMPGPAPNMKVRVRGTYIAIDLTRRRFLCVLFAFLTAESLVLIVLGICGASISESVKQALPLVLRVPVGAVYATVFALLFWQMIAASFWGLYYLGERLHQPDAAVVPTGEIK